MVSKNSIYHALAENCLYTWQSMSLSIKQTKFSIYPAMDLWKVLLLKVTYYIKNEISCCEQKLGTKPQVSTVRELKNKKYPLPGRHGPKGTLGRWPRTVDKTSLWAPPAVSWRLDYYLPSSSWLGIHLHGTTQTLRGDPATIYSIVPNKLKAKLFFLNVNTHYEDLGGQYFKTLVFKIIVQKWCQNKV